MATLASATGVSFSTTRDTFAVQVTGGGAVLLERRATVSDDWATAADIPSGVSVDVYNRVPSQLWRLRAVAGAPTVKAYDAA